MPGAGRGAGATPPPRPLRAVPIFAHHEPMTVTLIYSAERIKVGVLRALDGEHRRLVVACKWDQPPTEIYRQALPMLTEAEASELALALGLELPGG